MRTLRSGLSEKVSDVESLARFLTSSRLFNAQGVKHVAFLPNPQNGQTSVFRHEEEPKQRLWNIGLAVAGNRNLHGVAFIKAMNVRAATLDVVADEPPKRHANIENWPSFPLDPVLQKARQKEIAMLLAGEAILLKKA